MTRYQINFHRPPTLLKGLFAFLAIVICWGVLSEILARSPLGQSLPASTGMDSFEFDLKATYLEQHIRQNGQVDCILVGSSLANNGFDPEIIETVYEQKTGERIHCFNFGLSAQTFKSGGDIAQALVSRYNPKLLIVVVSPRDFSTKHGDKGAGLVKKAWLQYNTGNFSLEGWLATYSYGYRYIYSLQYLFLPENRWEFEQKYKKTTRNGFSPLYDIRPSEVIFPAFENFTPEPVTWSGLLKVSDLPVSMIFIEAPINPEYMDYYLETPENYQTLFFEPVEQMLASKGLPFWESQGIARGLPPDHWYDSLHANTLGVEVVSRWLGEQLAEHYPPGFFK